MFHHFALDETVSFSPISKDADHAAATDSSPLQSLEAQYELLESQAIARLQKAGGHFNGGPTTCPPGYVFKLREDRTVFCKPSLASAELANRHPETKTTKRIVTRTSKRLAQRASEKASIKGIGKGASNATQAGKANISPPKHARKSKRSAARSGRGYQRK